MPVALIGYVAWRAFLPRLLHWHNAEPRDEFVVPLGSGEVRARAFDESGWTVVSKMYSYVDFRSGPGGAWTNLLKEFGADSGPIDRDCITLVGPSTLHAHLGRTYTVTTDGGVSWATRGVEDMWCDATGETLERVEMGIWAFQLSGDGSGSATVRVSMRGEHDLVTSDFGRTWRRR